MECCLQCGRDTNSTTQICSRCYGHGKYDSQINDVKDRHVLDRDIEITGNVLDDAEYDHWEHRDKYSDNGKKNTDKFITKMNKRKL